MWTPLLPHSAQPRYLALVDAIAEAIERGELKVGERLPPQRRLAWALGLNPSTTQQAYREAAARHLVSGEVGRGTYVLAGSKEATLFCLKQGKPARIDLSTNVPAIDIHNRDVDTALQALINNNQARRLEHYLTADELQLGRALGATWLRNRGLNLSPQQVLLCAGAQQGLFSLLLSLCQAGDPVLVEALTAPGIKAACRQLRLPLHGVALDLHGIRPDDLERMARATGARVLVLTPTLHNPTGSCPSAERQREIAAVVRQHGLLVIEDDVYGALTDNPPLFPLLGQQGVLVTSLSKTVGAGLRLGWIAADAALLQRIDPHTQATHWSVSPLTVQIANRWITDGTAERRLAWQRKEITQRWRLARKILGTALQEGCPPSPHLWLTGQRPGAVLAAACRAEAVDVVPAEVFAVKQGDLPAIRVSLSAAADRAELKQALERIAQVLAHPAQAASQLAHAQ
ncbi:transcriptional regulator [Pseudomonas laurentiana]|uniref:PLP-dependent aminotransferase family protein n=1 Tax=Pseudomonas laurentiana TaxID=2364649 RepID=A0A6I5RV64_9PSED|nr:PLP-dependent aminotransferase family protein [Pseudomonas laurentiana]NES11639.1 PLP-dependent aminotransferase family protein [Pseudomonas laurentiana]GGU80516.1 transcriptional regulator [Pseudomonas laurentiana]